MIYDQNPNFTSIQNLQNLRTVIVLQTNKSKMLNNPTNQTTKLRETMTEKHVYMLRKKPDCAQERLNTSAMSR